MRVEKFSDDTMEVLLLLGYLVEREKFDQQLSLILLAECRQRLDARFGPLLLCGDIRADAVVVDDGVG